MKNVTVSDFRNFKVSDGQEACTACGPCNPLRPSAPVVIQGDHYCLWCALQIARTLVQPKVTAENTVRVERFTSVGELENFLKS